MLENRENYGLPFLFPLQKTAPDREVSHQPMFTPWAPQMAVSSPVTTLCHTPLVPNSLARPPHTWTKDEVKIWLEWCSAEFSIEPVSQDKFDMNGKALGLLTREDFKERDTSSGDLLFNALQQLMKKHDGMNPFPSFPSHVVSSPNMTSLPHHGTPCHQLKTPVHLSDPRQNGIILFTGSPTNNNTQPTYNSIEKHHTSYVPIRPVPVTSYPPAIPQSQDLSPKVIVPGNSMLSPAPTTDTDSGAETEALQEGDDEMAYCDDVSLNNHRSTEVGMTSHDRISENVMPHIKKSDGDCRLLWEFIHQLLQESKYNDYVNWERKEELIFRIVNPTGLAELWGYQKNRTNMTYEKLSRALRYYYKMNIIKKVSGKRLTYQFLQHPRNIKKGQRGARPHSARFIKQDVPPVPSPHPITEQHPPSPPISAQHLEDNQRTSQAPVNAPAAASYDSYDRQPDLQLIDGRLRPTTEECESRFDSEEDHTVPYIKPEVPVQEEPEDLSMKSSVKRRSSEFSDYVDHSRRSPGELDYSDMKLERIKMETS